MRCSPGHDAGLVLGQLPARRLLGLVRPTTKRHVDKQVAQCQRWAEAYGHETAATAADSNVSGKTDPFQRPELGPWLTDPHLIDSYDGIVGRSWTVCKIRPPSLTSHETTLALSTTPSKQHGSFS